MDLRFMADTPTDQELAVIAAAVPETALVLEAGRVVEAGHRARSLRHLLLPALEAVQSAVGWVSPGALNEICRRLSVPPAEAYGVATFYALISTEYRPPIVAHVCDDVVCRQMGSLSLLADLGDREDVAPSPCLGQCDRAPAAYVQRAGEEDLTLTFTNREQLLEALSGLTATEAPDHPMIPPPIVGGSPRRVLAAVGRVDPESLGNYREQGGYMGLEAAMAMGSAEVIELLKTSKLKGRGGAAFPTGIKWEAVARAGDQPKYVVCNADESEPGTFKDRVLIEGDPFAVVEAMTIAGMAVGAEEGYIYIRGEYPLATTRIRQAIDVCRQAGLLGEDVMGAGFTFDIEVRRGQGAYICGEETALFNSIEGFRGEPRQKPPFPVEVGLFGKPTVINNVETLINVLDVVTNGGQAFAARGTDESTGTRLFCLSGHVAVPGVYEVEFGATLRDLLELAGGVTGELQAILMGGAAGTLIGPDRLDLRLTFEDARAAGVALGSGVIVAFNASTDLADVVHRIARFFRDESCGQCVPCRVGTVRVEEVVAGANGSIDSALIEEIDRAMKDASICGLGHTAASVVRSAIDLRVWDRQS